MEHEDENVNSRQEAEESYKIMRDRLKDLNFQNFAMECKIESKEQKNEC